MFSRLRLTIVNLLKQLVGVGSRYRLGNLFMIFTPVAPPIKPSLKSETICLTFHDMVPERTASSLWFDCSVPEFEAELDWLIKRGAHFIALPQLYRHLTDGVPLPSNPVCITFADNYHGFLDYAYPILKKRRIPCAMFVHTGYVGSPIGRPKMTWSELKQLDRQGLVFIESQTVTHPADLRTMSTSAVQKEMTNSKRDLESHLNHPALFLAYPNGKFDARSEAAARKSGYLMAFSEVLTPAERSPSIFAVARYVHTKFKRAWTDVRRLR